MYHSVSPSLLDDSTTNPIARKGLQVISDDKPEMEASESDFSDSFLIMRAEIVIVWEMTWISFYLVVMNQMNL
jgi:hypothetical protein